MLFFVTIWTFFGIVRAGLVRRDTTCPSFWTDAAQDLSDLFVGSDGNCNDDARAAIRLSFHDCFPGACDGSIILSDECTTRQENKQLISICSTIQSKATEYNSSVADMIQLGTAIGLRTCPGAPILQFLVGRSDSSIANAADTIPSPNANASVTTAAFAAKGFTATDLVALVGAHSTAKNLNGDAFDSTVEDWDVTFYSETASRSNPVSLGSDLYLSNTTGTEDTWSSFAASQDAWNTAFVAAMNKMMVIGNDEQSLVDCSSVVTDVSVKI